MIAVVRRKQREVRAVKADTVQMFEVRITTSFTTHAEKVNQAILRVDPEHVRYGPIAFRDLVLQAPGRGIVKIEMAPVIPL